MWIDLLAALVLGAFAVAGARRGALASGLSLLALAGAYAAAVLAAPALGPAAAEALGLPLPLGAPAAGALVFVAAFLGLGLLGSLGRWIERRWRAGEPRSPRDRVLGALLGGVRGAIVVLLLGYLGLWLDALGAVTGDAGIPGLGESALGGATRTVAEAGAEGLLDDGPGGRLAARALARPAETFTAIQALLDDERVAGLRDDGEFWSLVQSGEVDAALERTSFLAVADSGELRGRFADLGLTGAAAADDPEDFREELAVALHEVAPRLRRLREDPELERLARDPEVVRLVRSGDTLGLLRHPSFGRLVARATADLAAH